MPENNSIFEVGQRVVLREPYRSRRAGAEGVTTSTSSGPGSLISVHFDEGGTESLYARRLDHADVPEPTGPVIYRCTRHATPVTHYHSQQAGTVHRGWDTGAIRTGDVSRAAPPDGYVRHTGPDGVAYRFSRTGTDLSLPEHFPVPTVPSSGRKEPHDSGPLWPVEQCTNDNHPVSGEVHYHVHDVGADPATARPGQVGWSSRTYETTIRTTVQGTRFARRTTTEESTMTTITPGTVVRSSGTRPNNAGERHQFTAIVKHRQSWVCLARVGVERHAHGWGWLGSANRDYFDGMARYRDFAEAADRHGCRFWIIPEDELTIVPADEVIAYRPAAQAAHTELARYYNPGVPSSGQAEVNLHPLTATNMRAHPNFMLHSILGTYRDGNIVFGCQTFGLDVVARSHGTVTFTEEGVRVSMPASREGAESVTVGDRRLPIWDVNSYTERIVAVQAPANPAEHVVLAHGYYACAAHPEEVLHLTPGRDGTVIGKIVVRPGSTLNGFVGQREGLAHRRLRDCLPVVGSTSESAMHVSSDIRYSLVPTASQQQRDHLVAQGLRLTVGTSTDIAECSNTGVLRAA